MNSCSISRAEVPAFQGTILCFSCFWQHLVGVYTWLDLRLLLAPYPFCSGFIKHYFFKFLGNLVAKYKKGDESSLPLDYHWHYCNCKCWATAFFCLVFIYNLFSPWNRSADLHILFRYFGKKPHSLTLYFFSADPVIWRYSCRIGISEWILQNAGFPTKITGGLWSSPHTPLSPVHHIWLDCCFGNRCNVASDFIMIKWGEKIEQKSTFLFQHATWKLKLSHIHSLYFRALFGNGTDLSC